MSIFMGNSSHHSARRYQFFNNVENSEVLPTVHTHVKLDNLSLMKKCSLC